MTPSASERHVLHPGGRGGGIPFHVIGRKYTEDTNHVIGRKYTEDTNSWPHAYNTLTS